jgi:hypothetical protein
MALARMAILFLSRRLCQPPVELSLFKRVNGTSYTHLSRSFREALRLPKMLRAPVVPAPKRRVLLNR